MNKLIITLILISSISMAFGQTDLNGVTIGFGAGPGYTFDKIYDYSLTTDADHNLKLQPLSHGAFVISSVIIFKLGSLSVDQNHSLMKQTSSSSATFKDRLSINLAINLVNVANNVSFNKNIDGGIGFGYFITESLQAAVFYDISRVPQLRDYIVSTYQDKPIPNGSGTSYNSLDTNDNNLFYNKTISGISVKLIFSIGNKKAN